MHGGDGAGWGECQNLCLNSEVVMHAVAMGMQRDGRKELGCCEL